MHCRNHVAQPLDQTGSGPAELGSVTLLGTESAVGCHSIPRSSIWIHGVMSGEVVEEVLRQTGAMHLLREGRKSVLLQNGVLVDG